MSRIARAAAAAAPVLVAAAVFFARTRAVPINGDEPHYLMMADSVAFDRALELARYGGAGPVGRFGWTAAWLWSIPTIVILLLVMGTYAVGRTRTERAIASADW